MHKKDLIGSLSGVDLELMLILMMMVMIVILMCTKKVLIGFCLPQGMEKSLTVGKAFNLPSSSSLSLSSFNEEEEVIEFLKKRTMCHHDSGLRRSWSWIDITNPVDH